jgi:threonyl-tRNA synthetase
MAFPVWLSPVQAVIQTVTEKQIPWGEEVYRKLLDADIRVERDFRNEKLGYKVREAQSQKTPYMLVIGDREVEGHKVSPRQRDGKNLGPMDVDAFIGMVKDLCARYQ